MIPLANHHASKVTARYSEMYVINLLETFCYLQPELNKSLDMDPFNWLVSFLMFLYWLVVEPTPLKNHGVKVSLGWWHSQLNGKIKVMFQTTNQIGVVPLNNINHSSINSIAYLVGSSQTKWSWCAPSNMVLRLYLLTQCRYCRKLYLYHKANMFWRNHKSTINPHEMVWFNPEMVDEILRLVKASFYKPPCLPPRNGWHICPCQATKGSCSWDCSTMGTSGTWTAEPSEVGSYCGWKESCTSG